MDNNTVLKVVFCNCANRHKAPKLRWDWSSFQWIYIIQEMVCNCGDTDTDE